VASHATAATLASAIAIAIYTTAALRRRHPRRRRLQASGVAPGTKIVLQLKPDETAYSRKFALEQNIRKYSNFVGFPIYVDGERVNTVEALWTKSKSEACRRPATVPTSTTSTTPTLATTSPALNR
jgi:hypothetical protein